MSCSLPPRGALLPRAYLAIGLLWLLATSLLSGCEGCNAENVIAVLQDRAGEVVRDYNAQREQWSEAHVGSQFSFGDAVKTGTAASAELHFDDGARLRLEPKSIVRFLDAVPGSNAKGLDVLTGDAVLVAGSSDLELRTHIGMARLSAGGVMKLKRTNRGLNFEVTVGQAFLGDSTTPVTKGQSVEVGIGMAILEREVEERPQEEKQLPPLSGDLVALVKGKGTRLQAPGDKKFSALAPGEHQLSTGTRLRLRTGASVVIRRGKQEAVLGGPGTYLITGNEKHFVEPLAGTTTLTADGRDVSMDVPGGSVTALGSQERSVGLVRVARGKVTVQAQVGKLQVALHGNTELLSAGETLVGSRKGMSIEGRGIDFADITVAAGGSLLIHDPTPPTAVGVRFLAACPHLGKVERIRNGRVVASAVGKETANLRFAKGSHRYQVRCLSSAGKLAKPVSRGRVTIFHDAGTAALAKTPPKTHVRVDGRNYTVLYQNRLPAVSVQWPSAPKAPSYTLTVSSGRGTKTYTTNSPSYAFKAGRLSEGKHRFQFRSSNGRSSRLTTASIRFDNAAPKASIQAPGNESFNGGAGVNVRGVALPGWSVSALGQELPMDGQHRFSGSVAAGNRGLALRFQHPQRGTHYYLRRASGVPR